MPQNLGKIIHLKLFLNFLRQAPDCYIFKFWQYNFFIHSFVTEGGKTFLAALILMIIVVVVAVWQLLWECQRVFVSMSHLWMDRPVKRESVSREGGEVSVERKEDSGSLWHRSHLHNSAGSRWTDWRINGQTERGRGETQKHTYSQALLHRLLLTQCRCKKEGEGGDAKR